MTGRRRQRLVTVVRPADPIAVGQAATDADGGVYLSAARYAGEDVGHFEYHRTRSDDPNDVFPHEHRRELRANRVVAAWLAHDDSRAVNTRNIKVKEGGRHLSERGVLEHAARRCVLGPGWATPVRIYFRRAGAVWTTVGLIR